MSTASKSVTESLLRNIRSSREHTARAVRIATEISSEKFFKASDGIERTKAVFDTVEPLRPYNPKNPEKSDFTDKGGLTKTARDEGEAVRSVLSKRFGFSAKNDRREKSWLYVRSSTVVVPSSDGKKQYLGVILRLLPVATNPGSKKTASPVIVKAKKARKPRAKKTASPVIENASENASENPSS